MTAQPWIARREEYLKKKGVEPPSYALAVAKEQIRQHVERKPARSESQRAAVSRTMKSYHATTEKRLHHEALYGRRKQPDLELELRSRMESDIAALQGQMRAALGILAERRRELDQLWDLVEWIMNR